MENGDFITASMTYLYRKTIKSKTTPGITLMTNISRSNRHMKLVNPSFQPHDKDAEPNDPTGSA